MSLQSQLEQGQLRAATDTIVCAGIAGLGGIAIALAGTWVGTVTFEGQIADGTWASLNMVASNGTSAVTTATSNGLFIGSCVGLSAVRARMSAFTSGLVGVQMQASLASAGGSGGGGGGGGDATAANQLLEIADLDKLAAQVLDYDTGAGTASQVVTGIALPASGGPVAGGTTTNPINVALPAATLTTLATAAKQDTGNTSLASIDGKITAVNTGAVVVASSALPSGASTAAKQPALGTAGTASADVISVQGISSMTPLLVTPAANSAVNVSQINGVTPLMGAGNTGTGSPRVTIATDQLVLPVGGNVAHDAADSGNPVKIGAKAISYGANPTAVAAADRTDVYANIAGIPFMLGGHPNVLTLLANFTSAQTNTALITVSAGTKVVMLSCTVAADHANTVDVQCRIGFATATTPTTTSVYLSHPGIAPGGGIREAGMVAGADDEDVRITCEVPTGGSIDVVMKYFTIAS